MKNYMIINGQKIELPDDLAEKILAAQNAAGAMLSEAATGSVVKIGEHEMVVLEHLENGTTALIRKDLFSERQKFGKNNNYDGSCADRTCNEFAEKIAAVVGEENIIIHTVDLTSGDGLKDYGTVERRASLLTAEQYRRYVEILDNHKINGWWWLATPYSTPRHENDTWVKCVAPAGFISGGNCNYDFGVRPFCILKSTSLYLRERRTI